MSKAKQNIKYVEPDGEVQLPTPNQDLDWLDDLAVELELNTVQTRWLRTKVTHRLNQAVTRGKIDELKAILNSDWIKNDYRGQRLEHLRDRISELEGLEGGK